MLSYHVDSRVFFFLMDIVHNILNVNIQIIYVCGFIVLSQSFKVHKFDFRIEGTFADSLKKINLSLA